MQIVIRDAAEGDIAAIAEIYKYYVQTSICTLELLEPSLDELQERFTDVLASHEPFIVAVNPGDHSICGYAYSGPFNSRAGYNHTAEDSIYIHKDYCNAGLGGRLLRELLDRLIAAGKIKQVLAKISLEPGSAIEQWPSCHLHMSCGFKAAGMLKHVGRKFDQWLDVVILQLDILDYAGDRSR